MITIVGGTYFERCLEPERNDVFGSGLRAAAALSGLIRVELRTYIDKSSEELVKANAKAFNVQIKSVRRPERITFQYSHPLATPHIFPPTESISRLDPIEIVANAVLCFGMLEGAAKIRGKRVVYDPQSPFDARAFEESDSTAERLALVLNAREAVRLAEAGKHMRMDVIVKRLFKKSGALVIVVKLGTHGALVCTRSRTVHIPAYKTKNVWKIGSGDIFAAVFAYHWAVRNDDPVKSATSASEATALYCDSRVLPMPKKWKRPNTDILRPRREKQPQVYLAGPFFTMAERWLISEARVCLQHQGVNVFSPLHDVGYGSAEVVAPADLKALRESDSVFAITDGLDSGTLFEIGYARARNIPVVVFVQNETSNELKMLEGSGCQIFEDFTSAIYNSVWASNFK